jgi:ABC-type Fe3+/spermidine/putrescine transport system ATPase subunit
MQLELKALNRSLGVTFIYVTHDQEEALTMSDRIAVMADARIAQLGPPAEIYENPRTEFVATFIGAANVLGGSVVERSGDRVLVAGPAGRFLIPAPASTPTAGELRIAVRPEWMDLFPRGEAPAEENVVPGSVTDVIYLGETIHVLVALASGDAAMVALRNEGQLTRPVPWKHGAPVDVAWHPDDCQVLDSDP